MLVNVLSGCVGGVVPQLLNLGDGGHHVQVGEENCRGVSLQNHLMCVRSRMVLPTRLFESVNIAWESANFCSASRTKITSVLDCSDNILPLYYFTLYGWLLKLEGARWAVAAISLIKSCNNILCPYTVQTRFTS